MTLLVNLFITFIHVILTYGVFISALISNKINVLLGLLILTTLIKIAYWFFGRCILTLYENNNFFPSMCEIISNVLTQDLDDKRCEEIVINIGLLIILNKLLVLIFFKYFKIL
jgi:hypothetical protein